MLDDFFRSPDPDAHGAECAHLAGRLEEDPEALIRINGSCIEASFGNGSASLLILVGCQNDSQALARDD